MTCWGSRGWRAVMCGQCLGVAVLALLLVVSPVAADWENDCPPGCKCTYSSNRKMADCEDAGFSTVPGRLSSEVQELNLNNNNIIFLEKDAFKKAGLINLQKLYLKDNGIRNVHKDAFRELGILIELDLGLNKIDKIHPHTFTGLGKLRKLDLSNNLLSRLDGVQFPVLPHLRKLYLNNNNLNYIHNYAFTNLHLLDSLKISNNHLKLIQPALFTNNSKLVDLVLHENLWECDCRLKPLVSWVKQNSLLQEHVTCDSPERVSGRRWEAISPAELACRPVFRDMAKDVPAALGQNATLTCRAYGEPLPQFKWVLNGRVLTNMSVIPYSQPEQTYIVHEGASGDERYSQLTVTHVAEHDFTYYTCVADNLAGLVEQNITLVTAAKPNDGGLKHEPTPDLYIIIGIVVGTLMLILFCTICICCCIRRRSNQQSSTAKAKLNGSAGGGGNFEHKNVLIVNPVEKPPRQYEQVPQTDLEMSTLINDPGGHHSYDDNVDYPGDQSVGVMSAMHRGQLPLPLATLEEEDDDLQHQDTTLTLDSTPGQSVLGDYTGHFPDLLDMTRGPRAISPTQLSYHSLAPTHVTPQHGGNDHWRYSYVDPNSAYAQYPVAYVSPTPIQQPRPGYVTLPRRQRTPSWAGETSNMSSLVSPQGSLKEGSKVFKVNPIYDTLGPRTTADGTSRTDLTRPGSRLADPYSPRTPTTPASPPNNLPPYYTPLMKEAPSTHQPSGRLQHPRSSGISSTLPRSTPNLLEGDSGLSLPYHPGPTSAAQSTMLDSSQPQANSPTPSTASTVRTASPAHRLSTTCPPSSLSPLHNGHYTSNESALDSPSLINNNNNPINSKNLANLSMDSALSMGSSAPSLILSGTGKKVPPKPPPKPSAKRLSLASNSSEPRKSSIGGGSRVFQDEGPDGTEV